MTGLFWGELLGTLFLILLGDGVVGGVLLNKSKAQNAGWIVITTGWAFAVMMGVFVAQAFGSPGGWLNPAVAIWATLRSPNPDWSAMVTGIVAEFIGAFIGAVLVYLHYLPHWAETDDKDLKLAVFSTGPAIRNMGTNLVAEIIGTFVLVVGVGAIFASGVLKAVAATGTPATLAPGLGPFLVGALVWAIGLSLGGPTGYAINPARDLGPRIAHFVLPIPGKGNSDWNYAWIPVVGPIIGAIIGALLLNFALGQ